MRPISRAFPTVMALLCAASLVPMLAVRYPPMPDLSQHLAAVSVLHHMGDPRYDLDRYYQLSLGLNPYWGYYGPMHALSYVFGVELAGRVFLGLYAVALPVGVALLARRFDRSPWLALFAFPVIWNFNFAIGFISFCVGLALLPFALCAFDAFCERPTPARFLAASSLGVAMYFAHLLPWGAWLACAGLLGLLHRGLSIKALALRLAAWLPSLVAGVVITRRGRGLNMGSVGKDIDWKRYPFEPTWQYARDFLHFGWWPCTGGEESVLLVLAGAAFVALFVTAVRARGFWPRALHDLRAEACLLVAVAAYIILPRSIISPAYWWGVNIRFASIAFLFLGLTIRGELDVRAGLRRWLLVPVALSGLGFSVDTLLHWRQAGRFCAGYDQLARLPEPGSRVLFVLGQPWYDDKGRWNYKRGSGLDHYVHTYYGIYQAQRGGFMPWNFDEGFPLRYKVRYPASGWRQQQLDWDAHAPYYDYVLAFNHGRGEIFGPHLGEVKKVGEQGRWSLWKLPGPRRDDSPWRTYPSPYL